MQVILCLFRSAKARMSSSVWCLETGRVVLMNTRWVVGISSSIIWSVFNVGKGLAAGKDEIAFGGDGIHPADALDRSSPGRSRSCPRILPLLMQKGQWFLQS